MTPTIAFSFAPSPDRDLARAGVGLNHLRHTSLEVALHLLRNGYRLAYGGDLRADGFTRALIELARTYADDAPAALPLLNFFAWSVHRSIKPEELDAAEQELSGAGVLIYLDAEGKQLDREEFEGQPTASDAGTWGRTLTAMRRAMADYAAARVVVGGRVEGYKGFWPGIAEEACLMIEAGKPLFVVGGFGGCARHVAHALGVLPEDSELVLESEPFRTRFVKSMDRVAALRSHWENGLSADENAALANTRTAGTIFTLMMKGLLACGVKARVDC